MNYIFLVFFFLCFSSCGLREPSQNPDNFLLGQWKMTTIRCYAQDNLVNEVEKYGIPVTTTISLKFDHRNFEYSAQTDSCSTSAVGQYGTQFEGDLSDIIDFQNLLLTGSCTENLLDTGPEGVGIVQVPYNMLALNTSNLRWFISEDYKLWDLQYFNNFVGSTNVQGCNNNCLCFSEWDLISE